MQVTNVCDLERSPNEAGTNPKVCATSLGITHLVFQLTLSWMKTFVPMIAYVAHGVLIALRFVAIGNILVYGQFHILESEHFALLRRSVGRSCGLCPIDWRENLRI